MTEPPRLRQVLSVAPTGEGHFAGHGSHAGLRQVFGGELIGQGLYAAGLTAPESADPHSLHAHFMRAGVPGAEIAYTVEALRDGRSYATRQVTALQGERALLTMLVSFHTAESSTWHHTPSIPTVPSPDHLPTLSESISSYEDELGAHFKRERLVDMRYPGLTPWGSRRTGLRPDTSRLWLRAEQLGSNERLLHFAALAYMSDMSVLDPAVMRHGLSWDPQSVRAASLDHAMWFHDVPVADDWVLFDQSSPWTGNGRGMAQAKLFQGDGRLLATVTQEASLRQP